MCTSESIYYSSSWVFEIKLISLIFRRKIEEVFMVRDKFPDAKIVYYVYICVDMEHIGRLARMSVLDTEVDGSNSGSSMLSP